MRMDKSDYSHRAWIYHEFWRIIDANYPTDEFFRLVKLAEPLYRRREDQENCDRDA